MTDSSSSNHRLSSSSSHPRPFEDHVYQPVQRDPEEYQGAENSEQNNHQSSSKNTMDAPLQRHLARVQIITPLSILLNLASLAVCSILIHPGLKEIHETHITQFTPNPNFILLYWGVLFLLQIGFAILIVVSQKEFTKKTIVYGVGVRLAISNLLLGAWAITWVVNNHASFLAGLVLLSVIGVLLLLTALILAVKYPPSSSRPLDWLFIHVPIKMFLVITLQVDIPQMLFMALGWYDTPKSTHTDIRALWPSFGILAGVGALSAIWIFAATDITWAISGIFLYFALLYSKTPELHDRRPEIVAAIILAMVLQAVALLGSLLYKWLGSYSQAEVDHEQEGRVALGRNPQEEAAALRAEAEAEAAAAAARERALSESLNHDQSDAGNASTAASDQASSLERGENNVKVSRRLG